MLKNTENGYGVVAKGFHWVMFIMLTVSIVAGNFLASLPKGTEKLEAAGMHKSFGLILLLLVLLRLGWRLLNTTPKDPKNASSTQNRMSHAMHGFLYILMFAQPLSGILMSQAADFPVSFFGAFELPILIEKSKESAEFLKSLHGSIWIALVIAVFIHTAAAIYHHVILKDDVLKRMTVSGKKD